MNGIRLTLPVVLVLSLLLSVTVGFFRAEYGFHNGLLFLVMFVLIGLTTYELRDYKGTEVIPHFMPTFITVALAGVVSIFSAYAGISLGNGFIDLSELACYAVAVIAAVFLSTSISVYNAIRAYDELFLGPLFTSLVIYAAAFIFGLVAVAEDTDSQLVISAGYAVFCLVVSILLIYNGSRNARL